MKLSYEEQIRKANEANPFMLHNHIQAEVLTDHGAEVTAEVKPESLNAMGGVHGGLMFVMAEIAAGLLVRNDGRRYVTLDSSFRFLSGAPKGTEEVRARASLTKRGRTVAFARAEVLEKTGGKLLAEGEFTFYCLDGEEKGQKDA